MTPYFPHESNARNDEKLIALRMKHGWEGYGIYWAIIEKLRDAAGYRLSTEYELIAYDLQADKGLIKSVINDFSLFEIVVCTFHSPALTVQMEWNNAKVSQARRAAVQRWEGGNRKPTASKSGQFEPPTLEEVTLYCQKRENNINPLAFIDFYESKRWMTGTSPMKDWKAAVRRWEKTNNVKQNRYEKANNDSRIHPALQ